MKKHLNLLIMILLAVLLAGCEFGIEGDIYVQDLVELPSLSEQLYIPAAFSVDYTSEERQGELQTFLEQNLRNVRNFRIEKHDYSEYSVVDFDIPLLGGDDVSAGLADAGDDLFSIFAEYQPDGRSTILYSVFNTLKFRQFQQTLQDEYWVDMTLQDATITFNLINDMRSDVNVQVVSVYANGVPAVKPYQITMARRDEVTLRFSDVLRDSLGFQFPDDNPKYSVRGFAVVELPTE